MHYLFYIEPSFDDEGYMNVNINAIAIKEITIDDGAISNVVLDYDNKIFITMDTYNNILVYKNNEITNEYNSGKLRTTVTAIKYLVMNTNDIACKETLIDENGGTIGDGYNSDVIMNYTQILLNTFQ